MAFPPLVSSRVGLYVCRLVAGLVVVQGDRGWRRAGRVRARVARWRAGRGCGRSVRTDSTGLGRARRSPGQRPCDVVDDVAEIITVGLAVERAGAVSEQMA